MGGRAEPCVGHIPDRRDHGSDFRAADAVEMDAAHGADAAAEFGRRTFGKLGGEFALAVPLRSRRRVSPSAHNAAAPMCGASPPVTLTRQSPPCRRAFRTISLPRTSRVSVASPIMILPTS